MATYPGPWIQGTDYTRPAPYLWNRVSGVPYGTATFDNTVGDGFAPYNDEMNEALDATAPTTTAAEVDLGTKLVATGGAYSPGSVTISTEIMHGGGKWDATLLLDLDYYWQFVRPTMPSDAVGVEYETTASTPVAANLHLEMTGGGRDTTLPPGSPATSIGASLAITIKAGTTYATATSLLADFTAAPGMAPFVIDTDMTWAMGPQGECAVAVSGAKETPWGYYDPNVLGSIEAGTNATNSTQMVYTLHPPRHRWLYLATPGIPPLRQFPRDDNLGTASAARIWPVSSQQGSLRRHGYF